MFRSTIRAAAALAVVPAVLTAVAGTSSAATASGSPATPAVCTGVIQITSLAFNPTTVAPGQSSTAKLVARNCTDQSQQTTATWFGKFIGPGVGIPPGCPAIDPFPQSIAFTPLGRHTSSVGYTVFSGCTATSLQITVRITGSNGTLLAQKTATLTIS